MKTPAILTRNSLFIANDEIKEVSTSKNQHNLDSIKTLKNSKSELILDVKKSKENILLEIELSKKIVNISLCHTIEMSNSHIKNQETEDSLYSRKQIKLLENKRVNIEKNFIKLEEKYQKIPEITTENKDKILLKTNKIYDNTISLKEKINDKTELYFKLNEKTLPDTLEKQNLLMNEVNNLLIAEQNNDNELF